MARALTTLDTPILADAAQAISQAYAYLRPLSEKLASRNVLGELDADDLQQIGAIACREQLHRFDANLSSLKTWSCMVGRSAMLTAIRGAKRRHRRDNKQCDEYRDEVCAQDDLIEVAERIREKVSPLKDEKRRPGCGGLGDANKLAVAMLVEHTGWSARKMAIQLREDEALRIAIGLDGPIAFRTVAWCASVCALAIKFRKILG